MYLCTCTVEGWDPRSTQILETQGRFISSWPISRVGGYDNGWIAHLSFRGQRHQKPALWTVWMIACGGGEESYWGEKHISQDGTLVGLVPERVAVRRGPGLRQT